LARWLAGELLAGRSHLQLLNANVKTCILPCAQKPRPLLLTLVLIFTRACP
jgi:hypothetical protein